jgi:protein-tyrosine phosphatase
MIDLHTHILPGLDDGPETLEGSLALARAATAAGTTKIVATPHINRHYGEINPPRIRRAVEELRVHLNDAGIALELLCGGEISTGRLPSLQREELEALRLGEGLHLLLEAPLGPGLGTLPSATLRLRAEGHGVLLAHPERSPGFQRDPSALRRLLERGALCSITASSLAGRFGETARRFSLLLLREGLVHDIASDTHDTTRRPPNMRAGLADAAAELSGVEELWRWLTEDAPSAIIRGAPLPPRPPLPGSRRRRGLLSRRG